MNYYKIAIIAIILVSCNNSSPKQEGVPEISINTQSKPLFSQYDTLMKFSYEMIPVINGKIDGNQNGGATAFFVSLYNRLFLVSNYHVFVQMHTTTKKPLPIQCDSIALRYKIKGSDNFKFKMIDLREIKKKHPPIYFFEQPDLFVYEIKMPDSALIYSIEHMFDTVPLKKLYPKEHVSYGYYQEAPLPQQMVFTALTYLFDPYIDVTDSVGGGRNFKLYNSYMVTPGSKAGMSGAPVFIKYDTIIRNLRYERLVFGGVIMGHDRDNTTVVKPYELYKILNEKLRQ